MDACYVLVTSHKSDATLETVNAFTDNITVQIKRLSGYYDGWTTALEGENDE